MGSLLKKQTPQKGKAERSSLEDELHQHLCSTCVVLLVRSDNLTKLRRTWVNRDLSCSDVQQRMIESIDEFHTKLDLHAFSHMNVLAQTQIDVIDWV